MDSVNIHLSSVDSTNNWIREWINNEQIADFSFVRADFQTAGRGQIGNRWESEQGKNLLMSFVVRPKNFDVHNQFYLSMAISVAIVNAIQPLLSAKVEVKWPNDIYVDDKKLAGILIENTLRGSQIAETIVGLGLNVNQRQFVSDAPNPISLVQLTNKEFPILTIADDIIISARRTMQYVDSKQFDFVKSLYLPLLYRANGKFYPFVDVETQLTFNARISDVEPDGRLLLIDEQNIEHRYFFKEVEYVI